MKFKIAWMYYDLLELYGDRGNIKVLQELLISNNIECQIDQITINDSNDISNHDLVFLGGGSDRAQKILEKDLFKRKNQFINVINNQGFILGICGGYQMLGKYYLDGSGRKTEGLGLFSYYTTSGTERNVGNVKIEINIPGFLENSEIVGFENHGGETYDVGNQFLGKVIYGHGNKHNSKHEGYYSHNFIGTYIHGPLLPKNPQIGKAIIEQVLNEKYGIKKEILIKHSAEIKQAKLEIRF